MLYWNKPLARKFYSTGTFCSAAPVSVRLRAGTYLCPSSTVGSSPESLVGTTSDWTLKPEVWRSRNHRRHLRRPGHQETLRPTCAPSRRECFDSASTPTPEPWKSWTRREDDPGSTTQSTRVGLCSVDGREEGVSECEPSAPLKSSRNHGRDGDRRGRL